MNRLALHIFTCIGAAMLFAGCAGYQLGEVKPSALAGIDRIHVPPFRNSTLEPRLSSLVTNAVLKEIQADGTYQVTNRRNCDAVLVGEITGIRKSQLRAVRNNNLRSQELSVYLQIKYHLEDPITGQRTLSRASVSEAEDAAVEEIEGEKSTSEEDVYLPRRGTVTGRTIQFVDPSFQVGERNAYAVAAQNAATKLVSQIADGW